MYVELALATSRCSSPAVMLASTKATVEPPETTSAVQETDLHLGVGCKHPAPFHEGDGCGTHGGIGEGAEKPSLYGAGRICETFVGRHAPGAAPRDGLVDADHAQCEIAVRWHLHAVTLRCHPG
jgi:hypothetical protein